MPKQANVESADRAARKATATPSVATVPGRTVGDPIKIEGPVDTSLGEMHTTRGLVEAFTIDDERMLIKLNVSAVSRKLVSVRTSEPHFANAVGLTMMAYNNRDRLSVRYVERDRPTLTGPEVVGGLEFGLGEDAFDVDDWPLTYQA